MLYHQGQRNYECPKCNNKFYQMEHLKRHLTSIHKLNIPQIGRGNRLFSSDILKRVRRSSWSPLIFHLVLVFSIRICRIFHHPMGPCLNATKWSRNVSSPVRNVPFQPRNSTIWMNTWKANIYNSMILLMSVRSVRTSRIRRPIWK